MLDLVLVPMPKPQPMRRLCVRSLSILSLSILSLWNCAPATAAVPYRSIDQFNHKAWTAKDGAPAAVTSLAQTPDGFLWLGTTTGLFRFDGVRFEKYRLRSGESLLRDYVVSLLPASDGLWICYFLGGLSFLTNGRLVHYGEREGLPASPVIALAQDRQGFVWAATADHSLMRLEGSRWHAVGKDWNFSGSPSALLADSEGTLWVITSEKVFFLRDRSTGFEEWDARHPTAFIETGKGLVWRLRPAPKRGEAPPLKDYTRDLEGGLWGRDGSGGIWHVKPDGLGSWNPEGDSPAEVYRQTDGLSNDRTTAMMRDREGNIWVGTNLGLDRFQASPIVPVRIPSTHSKFAMVPHDQGGIWATAYNSSSGGSLLEVGTGGITSDRPARRPISLYRDPAGALWTGTRGGGILKWSGGAVETIPTDAPMVGACTMDSVGRLWALFSGKGYFRWENRQWTSLAALGAPEHGSLTSYKDSAGRVWFGYQHDRVFLLEQEKLIGLTDKDGIRIGDVTTIGGRGAGIWIGGERGLEMFDGHRFVPILPANAPEFTGITAIVETAGEGLWIGEKRGIVHIPADELRLFKQNVNHRVAFRVYDVLDGLTAPLQPPFPSPAGTEGADGLIWFATANGVVWIDPKRIPGSGPPPHVEILQTTINGRIYDPGPGSLQLPAHTTDLQIGYTATSLAVPERVRFRYRLEGQDASWRDAGARREAFYTNLGPGDYRFHVIACDSEGNWNQTGAYQSFVIAYAFYQTWWFKLFYVALGAGALWLFYVYRLKLATERIQQRLGARMEERERIARELHDTLLQGFQGLMLRLQAVMKTLPAGEPASQMIEKVLDRADGVLLEGRQSVRNLREEGATGNELTEAVASIGDELLQSNHALFNFAVLGTPKPLSPIVFHDVRRIAREALINAFQHSQAAKIEVELSYAAVGLSMRIRDDGVGIDPAILQKGKTGHWGLSGMRERAQKVGAKLNIWSNPGAGTEIELVIPAAVAYPSPGAEAGKNSLWRRILRVRRGAMESEHS